MPAYFEVEAKTGVAATAKTTTATAAKYKGKSLVFLIALPSLRQVGMKARCSEKTKVVCRQIAAPSLSLE
jgi:hypothetical protein